MTGDRVDPIQTIAEEHDVQLGVCDLLEEIANGLPDDVNPLLVGTVHDLIDRAFMTHMRFEDETAFSEVAVSGGDGASLIKILDQLTREHGRDEGFVLELSEEFVPLVRGRQCRNAEMLGYMLRGFFESQRSHIELESNMVIPAARSLLTSEDLSAMRVWLEGHHCFQLTPEMRRYLIGLRQ